MTTFDPFKPVRRWTPQRKNALIDAICSREISASEACTVHKISKEELGSWFIAYAERGIGGLYATRQGGWVNV